MKFEDVFTIAPLVGVVAGVVAHASLGTSLFASMIVAFSVALFPYAVMAVLLVVVTVFFGGIDNDRPPCECGECSSNQYSYDENQTAERNGTNDQAAFCESCYRCPKCQRLWVSRGKVFYRVEDDRLVPYRKQTFWGRWVPVVDEHGEMQKP
jgi:hypothetical protein